MISFPQQPNKYSPVNNPIIFQVSSDNSNIQYFTVLLTDDEEDIIANLKIYTTPDNRMGSYTDLSSILSNCVNYQLLPSNNLVEPVANVIQPYQLTITEKLYSNGTIIDGTTSTTGIFYAWNGALDKVQFRNFNYPQYVMTTGATSAYFLTNKPDLIPLNANSSEYLYFLNDGVANTANISTYGALGSNTYTVSLSGSTTAARIDISPASLTRVFNIDFSTVNNFTVQIFDSSNTARSILKNYRYRSEGTLKYPIEVLFWNRSGGFDSYTFYNTRESVAVTKTNIAKNPFSIDGNGKYTDNQNGVFNPDNETINVSSVSTYKAISAALTDYECIWLKELMQSAKVFVKLPNASFLPVQVNSNSYPVLNSRYTTSLNRLEIEFVASGDAINSTYDDFNDTFSAIFF